MSKAFHGIKIACSALEIYHLLFVDDDIFFARATKIEVDYLMDILDLY